VLRAGASCRARIEAELKRDVTVVPFAALLQRPGGSVAFVAVPDGAGAAGPAEATRAGGAPETGDAAAATAADDTGAGSAPGLYRLQRREVELGASSVSDVEVTAGVEEGELVVVGNLSLLRDGLLVTRDGMSGNRQDGEQ